MYTETLGLKTRYYDAGSGPAVLFLHGWGASFTVYQPLLDHLSQTHRILAPDLPGVGETEEPSDVWRTANYIEFVRAFVAERDVPVTALLGHSHGGRIILAMMGSDNPLPGIRKIVLFSAAGLKDKHSLGYYLKVYRYKAAKWLLTPLPGLKKKLMKRSGSADYRAASEIMRGTMSRVLGEDFTACLPHIKQPTLLLWGEHDTATPLWMAKTMEKNIPDAGLVVLPGGHYAFLEQWGRTVPVLDVFLG